MPLTSSGSRKIKAQGREAENKVVEYLDAHGLNSYRIRQHGINDQGDVGIHSMLGVCLEVKDEAGFKLGPWVGEMEAEMIHAGSWTGAVVHKRRGTLDAGRWYTTLPFGLYVPLLQIVQKAQA